MTPRETFIRDIRRDPRLAGHADTLARALNAMASEGYDVEDAATCLRAIEWIISQDLTVDQKLHHIGRLLALGTVSSLNMQEFIRLQ
jgi:hypothetical protein